MALELMKNGKSRGRGEIPAELSSGSESGLATWIVLTGVVRRKCA